MSHLASHPASLKSQGCWILWIMVAATWLTQFVMVTRHVGHTCATTIVTKEIHSITIDSHACLTHLYSFFAFGTYDVTILTAWYRRLSGNWQTHWTHHRLLQLAQERLSLRPLLLQLLLPLDQLRLKPGELLVGSRSRWISAVAGAGHIIMTADSYQTGSGSCCPPAVSCSLLGFWTHSIGICLQTDFFFINLNIFIDFQDLNLFISK